jgi:hypothetical protein
MSCLNRAVATDPSTLWSAQVQYPSSTLEITPRYCAAARARAPRKFALQVRRNELSIGAGNLDRPVLARVGCAVLLVRPVALVPAD